MSMTAAEARRYVIKSRDPSRRIVYLTSLAALRLKEIYLRSKYGKQELSTEEENTIYIATKPKRGRYGIETGVAMRLEEVGSQSQVFILNPESCQHLIPSQQNPEVQVCGVYGTDQRPGCCERYEFGAKKCLEERRNSGLSPLIRLENIAVIEG